MSSAQLLVLFGFVVLVCTALLAAVPIYSGRLVRSSGADRSIAIPRADLVERSLPMVCARTGEPADGLAVERSDHMSPAAIFALVAGPIGFLLLALGWLVGKRNSVVAEIPLSAKAQDGRDTAARRALGIGAIAIVVALAAAGGAVAWGNGWGVVVAALLGLASVTVAIVFAVQARMARVRVRRDREGELVFLDGVHPTFVEQVQRAAAQA